MSFLKMLTATSITAPAFNVLADYVNIPIMGVPVTLFGAAAFGAGLSLFFGDPIKSRRNLGGQVLAATFFGVAAATFLTDAYGLAWAAKYPSMFALVVAAIVRWFLPPMVERGAQIIKTYKISFSIFKGGEDK